MHDISHYGLLQRCKKRSFLITFCDFFQANTISHPVDSNIIAAVHAPLKSHAFGMRNDETHTFEVHLTLSRRCFREQSFCVFFQ